ncbi:alpha/beta fold hydrolase [Halobacillus salinarum]|uniref:Alpha/beta fold hydrolase n=1 Tax=Halobacillus salinarum TaxID=2932257 RepID=A0ABY4EPC4_9BACI|nr:alpha/beta fold hydrolase [Halobacillus salinarum]UOQ45467.1 alpha/beta fold hydrolase [Halobacillus salinarum]
MKKIYMLHGFMGTADAHFSNQISYFNEQYEIIPIDLPGHGDSSVDAAENYFDRTLDYVEAQIEESGAGYLLGLSLGASLAGHMALRKPELVDGIILTGYTPYIPEGLKEAMEKQYDYFLTIEENDITIARTFEQLHGDKWKKTLQHVLHNITFHYPTLTEEKIKQLNVPVLLLNGSVDQHEVEAVAYVKNVKNDALIGLIPGAGHTANMDQPEMFNRIVENFLLENKR